MQSVMTLRLWRENSDGTVENDETIRQMCENVTLEVNDDYTREFPERTLDSAVVKEFLDSMLSPLKEKK